MALDNLYRFACFAYERIGKTKKKSEQQQQQHHQQQQQATSVSNYRAHKHTHTLSHVHAQPHERASLHAYGRERL